MIKLEFDSFDELIRHLGRADSLASENRLLDDRLYEARERVRFLENRVANLEAEKARGNNTFDQVVIDARKRSIKDLILAVQSNSKIGAIKEARLLTGLGLKDAKDLVEEVWPNRPT